MRDNPDERFEEMLIGHLRSELDGYAGTVAPSIEASIKRRQRDEASPANRRRLLIWVVSSAGAIAASVGIVWGVISHQDVPFPQNVALKQSPTSTGNLPVAIARVVQSATSDEGTILLSDGGTARRVRQRTIETTTFYDPVAHATLEVSVPGERVTLVGLHAY